MEENAAPEDPYRINVKQTAKGIAYWDVTARGKTIEEVSQRLDEVVKKAEATCKAINEAISSGETPP